VKQKRLSKQHSTMTPTRARTQSANHEVTAPLYWVKL